MYNYKTPFIPSPNYKRNNNLNSNFNTINIPNNNENYNKSHENNSKSDTRSVINNSQTNSNEALFEVFGLKIYFDDLLLICILFFLYQEGIQDEYLFISLILLLLS